MTTIVKRVIDRQERLVRLTTRNKQPKPLVHAAKPIVVRPDMVYWQGEMLCRGQGLWS
jgi:hypothetical protein